MARGRRLRRRIPHGRARRTIVRSGRRQPFHHPRNAADSAPDCLAREAVAGVMTATRPYAEVIGDPIDHSLSPTIHSFWLQALAVEGAYRRLKVGRDGF